MHQLIMDAVLNYITLIFFFLLSSEKLISAAELSKGKPSFSKNESKKGFIFFFGRMK